MKKIPTFLSGMLTMALIGGLGVGALAATGQVSFNASALSLNGTQVSAKGENYTLANGQSVPASITYTDEKGGGTTYLPVRRISELLGVETGWDGATGSVTVGKTADTTAVPADYSDWTAEEEAAYQEFKGMWSISNPPANNVATARDSISRKTLQDFFNKNMPLYSKFAIRLATESMSDNAMNDQYIWFGFHGGIETERYAAILTGYAPDLHFSLTPN